MSKIIFKKVERVCPHNESLRKIGNKRGIVYDYEIWDNGIKKGVFKKDILSRGYTLFDVGGKIVKNTKKGGDYRPRNFMPPNKLQFEEAYLSAIPYIPTNAQIAERKEKEKKEKAAQKERDRQDHILWLKEQAAPELYEACKQAFAALYMLEKAGHINRVKDGVIETLEKAIAKAEDKQ